MTLISSWGTAARVIAAEINLDPPMMRVGMTPIIEIPKGYPAQSPEILKLLSWAMGTPKGDLTKPIQGAGQPTYSDNPSKVHGGPDSQVIEEARDL